jgi:hypothetical protein
MTLKHTPGPWKLRLGTGVQYDYIIETKGGALIAAYPHYSGATKKVTKANARLIAAAPELLAIVEAMAFELNMHLSAGNTSPFSSDTTLKVRAAIAKATGETQ